MSEARTMDFKDALKPIKVEYPYATANADDVLRDIDRLRRDLSGYHGQLKAHNDLQRHCDNQRERISELEGLYAKAKADRDENAMNFSKEYDRAEFLARRSTELRKQGERLFEKTLKLASEKDKLKGENSKLRKLCADMWFWGYEGHIDSESPERQMKHVDGVLDRLLELGVIE